MLVFQINSGKAFVSDPCYDLESTRVIDVVPGQYELDADADEEGQIINWVQVIHTDCPPVYWENAPFHVGVDSGQAGIFDVSHYKDDTILDGFNLKNPICPDELWYSFVTSQTLEDPCYGVIPFGAVSRSGFGDGRYECKLGYTCDRQISGVLITFVTDEPRYGADDYKEDEYEKDYEDDYEDDYEEEDK